MKSAYELAMERLNAASPNENIPLTDAQKEELADMDNKYTAKLAERKIALQKRIADAGAKGDFQEVVKIQEELRVDIQRIESDREAAKERVRSGKQHGV
jgi:hypothetical protein